MTRIEFIAAKLPIIYPRFYSIYTPALDEMVFLRAGVTIPYTLGENALPIATDLGKDRTAEESFHNHFHLFDKISRRDVCEARSIGKKISMNLLESLQIAFPTKSFIVYMTFNPNNSTIIRFHQKWAGEKPYYDTTATYEKGTELYRFQL